MLNSYRWLNNELNFTVIDYCSGWWQTLRYCLSVCISADLSLSLCVSVLISLCVSLSVSPLWLVQWSCLRSSSSWEPRVLRGWVSTPSCLNCWLSQEPWPTASQTASPSGNRLWIQCNRSETSRIALDLKTVVDYTVCWFTGVLYNTLPNKKTISTL